MEKEFVNYEQALALKELGFDEPCLGYYYTLNGKDWTFSEKAEYHRLDDEINIGPNFSLLAPLYQQVFRWFREKYNLIGLVEGGYDNGKNIFTYIIWDGFKDIIVDDYYLTYEKAEDACIDKLISILKEQKDGN